MCRSSGVNSHDIYHRLQFQVIHSRRFMRSGTVVGSFKIDLKTVYDAAGTVEVDNSLNVRFSWISSCFVCLSVFGLAWLAACLQNEKA